MVKGHAENLGNNKADTLANAGRESNTRFEVDKEGWVNNHPALHDGATLQAPKTNMNT